MMPSVVEMGTMPERTNASGETARWKQRCIYRVPDWMKDTTNKKAYCPQFVSLGPLHHGKDHLKPMEEHKLRAVQHMVRRSGRSKTEFESAINEVVSDLGAAYDGLDNKWLRENRGSFVEMMVRDGCFLLEVIQRRREIYMDYAVNDPVFSMRSSSILWPIIRSDMIRMENQLPLLVLQRLLNVAGGDHQSAEVMVVSYLESPKLPDGPHQPLDLHPLGIFHKSYCGRPHLKGIIVDQDEPGMPSAFELSEAGIHFQKISDPHDVGFSNGVLRMPQLLFHDSTEVELLNLMAFEWLHTDDKQYSWVSSYVSFLYKMIKSERDVALLRSKGIFVNMIGSDKKVVKLFNILTKLARGNDRMLAYVQRGVNQHCSKRRNKWRASFMNKYLSNPWVFISLLAATILLVATVGQTVYTVLQFYTKSG
ncbi:hypothetical protein ACP4OV_027236 [Aristida adscensionis]